MKPFKFGQPIANWLLRLTLVVYILLLNFEKLYPINLNNSGFYFAAAFALFALALLLGGFLSKQTLTVFSGLAISILSTYFFIRGFNGTLTFTSLTNVIPAVLGFYFFSRGNKS